MKRISFALLILILLSVPSTVLADMAPPAKPPGSNLQPGSETTQVHMVAETVVVDVQSDTTPDSLGRARVTADFTMRNLGTESESMAARFPISVDDGFGIYLEIEDLIIKVDGEQVPYQRTKYPADYPRNGQDGWAEFNITFPVGQDVSVRVVYNLNGSGYMPYTSFYYILETGAGWKDTIGSADIILRLPYPVSPQNVIVYMQVGRGGTTSGGVIQDSEMRWHFDNFGQTTAMARSALS